MKKILIICVNYNSYDALLIYLQSIDRAAKQVFQAMEIDVCIADNSSAIQAIDTTPYRFIKIQNYVTHSNLGYLGGAKYVLHQLLAERIDQEYDYLAISNVDLEMDASFFHQLGKIDSTHIGWIAPSIYSEKEHKDRNPKILCRPSKRHLQLAKLIYLHPMLYKLYVQWVYKKRKQTTPSPAGTDIYAGHGAFMLFSHPQWILECIDKFSPFLFCEEHFFAEEARKRALRVVYYLSLKLYDVDHVSTSTIDKWQYCQYNRQAIQFIIKNYMQ